MKITLVRHGRTAWNAIKKLQGHTDIPLNETGRSQAQKVGEYLKDESFDLIISSDLLRASQTADAIAAHHISLPYQKTPQLREKHIGIFQGRITDDICKEYDLLSKEEYYDFVDHHESVETNESIEERIQSCLEDLINSEYTNVCIVSHSGAIKRIRKYLRGVYDETSPLNCSVSRYEKVGDIWKEISFSESKHLSTGE